jgi:hypothetical protein
MSAAITTRRQFSRTSAAFAAGLFSKLSPATAASLMHNPYYNGPITNHFDGLRFFNPKQHRFVEVTSTVAHRQ